MTTVAADNVRAVAVPGTFDDCQDLVKAAFNDPAIRARFSLAAVNSINWARVMAQTVYYWWVAAQLRRPFSVAVPTGNFGNVLAASVAQRMGAPIERMIVGNNANHGLETLISTGRLPLNSVSPTLAPAMDIAVPSNLERYLHGLFSESGLRVAQAMETFRSGGSLVIDELSHTQLSQTFSSGWVDDAGIEQTVNEVFVQHGITIDPHTAVAWKVGNDHRRDGEPLVVVSTAHPAKFGEAVQRATGATPILPDRVAGVLNLPERTFSVDADMNSLVDMLATVGDSAAG
jgi:threonine synthase